MQIQININKKELKQHGTFEFPVNISYEVLSLYERGVFLWHWHSEIELTIVLEGKIQYQVNDTSYLLNQGEGVFCNANALHTGHTYGNEDCKYISVTFHPRLVYGFDSSLIKTKYIDPLIDSTVTSILLRKDDAWQENILNCITQIHQLSNEKTDGYEIEIQLLLSTIILAIHLHGDFELNRANDNFQNNINRTKTILSFIHEHYMDKITLEDIAATINICKSECCRFFKAKMGESLFNYLLRYRIEKSLPLLIDLNNNITEIASMSGFPNPCYFSKVFKKQMNCTPKEYRNLHH